MTATLNDIIAGIIALASVLAVVYASIAQGRPDAMTALVGIAGAATGFYLRGKVQTPTPPPLPEVPPTP